LGLDQYRLNLALQKNILLMTELRENYIEIASNLDMLQKNYILLQENYKLLESSCQHTKIDEVIITFVQDHGTLCLTLGVCAILFLVYRDFPPSSPPPGGGSLQKNIIESTKNINEAAVDAINRVPDRLDFDHVERFVIDRYGTRITFDYQHQHYSDVEGLIVRPLNAVHPIWIPDIANLHYYYSTFIETGLVCDEQYELYGDIYTGI